MSGVKVTNQRPAVPIPDSDSVAGVDDGTGNVEWDPDTTNGIPPGDADGDVLTWDGDEWVPEPVSLALDDLTDVDAPAPVDGEVLTWVDADGMWEPVASPAGSVSVTDGATTVADVDTLTTSPGGVENAGGGAAVLHVVTSRQGEQHDVSTVSSASGATLIDCSLANIFDLTLTANITISFSNPPPSGVGGHITIILRQGGAGSYTVTWPASVKWPAANGTATGSAPTLHTAVGAEDVIDLGTLDGGTTWGGSYSSGATVTSVGLTVPAEFSVAGSPVTSSGTLAVSKATQSANQVWAGPISGAAAQPAFRALVAADLPAVSGSNPHVHVLDCLYSGDGSTTAFELPAAPIDQYSVAAYVAGVLTEVTLSGTLLTTATFGSAPASASNNVRFDIVAAVT